jgi:hypothetical protein
VGAKSNRWEDGTQLSFGEGVVDLDLEQLYLMGRFLTADGLDGLR